MSICLKLSFCVAVALALLAQSAQAQMTAHFIDVGQGDAALLEFPCAAVLIDAGGDDDSEDVLLEYLRDFFTRRTDLNNTIDTIFITHTHIDHNRNLRDIVEEFTVNRYVHNGIFDGSGWVDARWMRDHANEDGRSIAMVPVGDSDVTAVSDKSGLTAGIDSVACAGTDPRLAVVSGRIETRPSWWTKKEFEDGNNQSLAIRIDYGEFSMLFTGDMEEVADETLVEYYRGTDTLDVDLYQVGHHGSKNGTTVTLLEAMTPDIAVISMGEWTDGRLAGGEAKSFTTYAYGHPNRRVVELLRLAVDPWRDQVVEVRVGLGAKDFEKHLVPDRVYGTGWDGTILVHADAGGATSVSP